MNQKYQHVHNSSCIIKITLFFYNILRVPTVLLTQFKVVETTAVMIFK